MILKLNKEVGSTFIIAGTAMGAGMLALPLVTAGAGIIVASLLLFFLWGLMLYTALLILDINLCFSRGSSFSTMTKALLGKWGGILSFCSMLLLFYALCTAYISGGTQLIASLFIQPGIRIVPTWLFSAIICWKTYAVDCVNRWLFSCKMLVLVVSVIFLLGHAHTNLAYSPFHHVHYVCAAIPLVFTAFGFHGSIPSVVKYVGKDRKKLRKIIIIGSIIPLAIYFLWLLSTLLILPLYGHISFSTILNSHNSVVSLIQSLSISSNDTYIKVGINMFSDIAVTTSFLGVGLGLFDYFYDLLKSLQSCRRFLSGVITFLPPLVMTLMFPHVFIVALGFASIALAFLAVILPAWMGLSKKVNSYQCQVITIQRSTVSLYFIIGMGVFVILMQILMLCHGLNIFH